MNELYNDLLSIADNNIDGMNLNDAAHFIDNDAIPAHGSVSGLIYYEETEPLAKKHHDQIIQIMDELSVSNLTLNDMAWLAWEYYILGNSENVLDDIGFYSNK